METDDDNWQTVFFEELVGSHSSQQEEDEEIDVVNDNNEDAAPKIKSYKKAITALEEVSRFLEYREHGQESLRVGSVIDSIATLRNQSAQQTTLYIFLTQ